MDTISQDDTPRKRCNTCGGEYPPTTDYFYANRITSDRLTGDCKPCCRAYARAKRATPEGRAYQTEYNKRYGETHKEARIEYNKQWYQSHHQHVIENNKRWRYTHPEHRNQTAKRWNDAHREQRSEYNKDYHATLIGRENSKARRHNRRAREKQVQGTHTPQQIREQYQRQKGKCYYCHKKVTWGKHHIEHTFPISRMAGTNIPANDISYLVIACDPCDRKKNNKFPWEWPEGGRLL